MGSPNLRFLPPEVPANQVLACFGVVSDTHMPQRCAALPPSLAEVFRGVDLILHAGDVGELWVLDELSRIAPVVAVHGNDDTPDAQRELPAQQVITAHGQRVLLYHSHHPDRAEELRQRQDDAWGPKLAKRLEVGRRAGASVVVYGHTHIPMHYRENGLLVLNPGAIASGSATTRQRRQTVALLYLFAERPPLALHVDLAAPTQIFHPDIDWQAGFRAALGQFSATLVDPELAPDWPALEATVRAWMDDPARTADFDMLYAALLGVARRCWAGETEAITRVDALRMLDELDAGGQLAPEDVAALRAPLVR